MAILNGMSEECIEPTMKIVRALLGDRDEEASVELMLQEGLQNLRDSLRPYVPASSVPVDMRDSDLDQQRALSQLL